MSLSKKQKDFLKTIENPKDKKYQKQQFKLQNKFYKFGLGEEIIFIDGIFKTDNPELIAFFNECPMVGKVEENSLTKESLRDITDPKTDEASKFCEEFRNLATNPLISEQHLDIFLAKTDQILSKEPPIGDKLELSEMYLESILNDNLSLDLVRDLKGLCVKNKLYSLSAKFRDKEKELEKKVNNLQLVEAFKSSSADVKEAKQKIARLVKEIDKCIALLND